MTQFRSNPTSAQERTAQYRNWDELDDAGDDEQNAYVDLIQNDPVVCDTCFLFRYDVLSCEWWRGTFGWSEYVKWTPVPGRSSEVPGETAASGVRLVCKNCGRRNEKLRPIPSHLLDEYAQNLSSTLDSKGIDHDRDVLINEIEARNTSENQGRQDSHVFGPAVERAIRRANPSSATATPVADD